MAVTRRKGNGEVRPRPQRVMAATTAKCVEMKAFLKNHGWRRPDAHSNDPHERKLQRQWVALLRRCAGPRGHGTLPSEPQLTPQACAHVERIEREIKRRLEVMCVEMKCFEMEAFLKKHRWRRPSGRSTDPHERKLRKRWDDLLRRRAGPIGQGTMPSQRQLQPLDRAHVERIEREIKKRLEAKCDEMAAFLEKHRYSMKAFPENLPRGEESIAAR